MNKKLNDAFETKANEEFITWKGQDDDPNPLVGRVLNTDISNQYDTPFMTVEDLEGTEHTVYLSSGLFNIFKWSNFIKDNDWNENHDIVGEYIGIRFDGEEKNQKTGRNYNKFTVLFQKDLVEKQLLSKKILESIPTDKKKD